VLGTLLKTRGEEPEDMRVITFSQIKREVCKKHGITVKDFDGRDQKSMFCRARRQAWWRARQETKASLPQLGAWSGGREHTTVYHGIQIWEYARRGEEAPSTIRKREYSKKRWQEKKSRGDI